MAGSSWVKPLAIGAGCCIGGALLAPIAVPAALSVIGFTSSGVAGGSLAAAMMSSVGNVAAGNAIATMQSIGAAGLGATGTAVGATVSGVCGVAAAKVSNSDKDNICKNCHHCMSKHILKKAE